MAKVKKGTGLTGRRNAKPAKGPAARSKPTRAPTGRKGTRTAKGGARGGRGKVKTARAKVAKAKVVKAKVVKAKVKLVKVKAAPAVQYAVKPLDPQRKCGPGTSVQFLYRVDERAADQKSTTHLVFFDRHGWYCEHGRNCPAVAHARKYNGHIARAS